MSWSQRASSISLLSPIGAADNGFVGRVVHTAEYRNADRFAGQRVLVAGAGSSGLEIAHDLSRSGCPEVLLAGAHSAEHSSAASRSAALRPADAALSPASRRSRRQDSACRAARNDRRSERLRVRQAAGGADRWTQAPRRGHCNRRSSSDRCDPRSLASRGSGRRPTPTRRSGPCGRHLCSGRCHHRGHRVPNRTGCHGLPSRCPRPAGHATRRTRHRGTARSSLRRLRVPAGADEIRWNAGSTGSRRHCRAAGGFEVARVTAEGRDLARVVPQAPDGCSHPAWRRSP